MSSNRRWRGDEATSFLNVDVDVWGKSDLCPLIAALGSKVLLHYVGGERGGQSAHFSLASSHGKRPDTIIRRLVGLIQGLPAGARRLWNQACCRDFNVGIQGGIEPFSHEIAIEERTLALVAAVRGRIVITTYALAVRRSRRKRVNPERARARTKGKRDGT